MVVKRTSWSELGDTVQWRAWQNLTSEEAGKPLHDARDLRPGYPVKTSRAADFATAGPPLRVHRQQATSTRRLALFSISGLPRMASLPMVAPLFPAGKEPLPPGITEEEKTQYEQMKRWQGYTTMAMESCVAKSAIAGVGGACIPRRHSPRRAHDSDEPAH
jgi:hypothetical protein